MNEAPVHRYAVYFAPRANSPWWLAGSRWLGRCAARGEPIAQAPVPGLSAPELHRLTKAPRRYGLACDAQGALRAGAGRR